MHEKIILDVRTPEEYKMERIKGSIDIPLSFIETREDRVAKLLKGKEVLIICRSGRRAEFAKQILAPHTEIDTLNVYLGGILEYKKEFPDQIETQKTTFTLPIMRQVQIVAG
jgi:rhodanese-related sulfurtransferase